MTLPPPKKQTLEAFLSRGIAMLHVDARRPGVLVPDEFAEEPHLRLNLSYRFQIPDLEVTEASVQATLSFRGRHFHCVLPWPAVFGITSQATGDGQVWPEDLPVEVASHLDEGKGDSAEAAPAAAASRKLTPVPGLAPPAPQERRQRGTLAAVEGGAGPLDAERESGGDEPPRDNPPDPGAPKRGHLRLVR